MGIIPFLLALPFCFQKDLCTLYKAAFLQSRAVAYKGSYMIGSFSNITILVMLSSHESESVMTFANVTWYSISLLWWWPTLMGILLFIIFAHAHAQTYIFTYMDHLKQFEDLTMKWFCCLLGWQMNILMCAKVILKKRSHEAYFVCKKA